MGESRVFHGFPQPMFSAETQFLQVKSLHHRKNRFLILRECNKNLGGGGGGRGFQGGGGGMKI